MTELKELENLNRDQRFGTLKSICKARVDWNLCIEVVLLALVLVAIFSSIGGLKLYGLDIPSLIVFIAVSCMLVLGVLSNYRFRKKSDSLNTPDQLLHMYEKTVQNNRKCWFAIIVLLISKTIIDTNFNGFYFWLLSAILLVLVVVYVNLYLKNDLLSQREKDIIMALQELAEEK